VGKKRLGLLRQLMASRARGTRIPQRWESLRGMARPAGFEPAATGLEGRCSIQLSYGRVN
jgi:hypothetical protein